MHILEQQFQFICSLQFGGITIMVILLEQFIGILSMFLDSCVVITYFNAKHVTIKNKMQENTAYFILLRTSWLILFLFTPILRYQINKILLLKALEIFVTAC